MNTTGTRELVEFAVTAAVEAGELTLSWFSTPGLDVEAKADGSPVTEADRAAERLLREKIATAYPDHGIIGEEEGVTPGSSALTWIIDPIDGTYAFARGVPLYSTLIAVTDQHGPLLGVIRLPGLDETIWAARGMGCWHNGRPAHVSDVREIEDACLATSGMRYWPDHLLQNLLASGIEMTTWGDGYGYALVATGRVEAMVDPVCNVWDVAAMPVIITEAGGRYSDFNGAQDIHTGTGVATNGHVHNEVLALLGS